MFERFTDRARKVTVDAQAAARRLGHGHIGTEHSRCRSRTTASPPRC
jgi:hypothetical protein